MEAEKVRPSVVSNILRKQTDSAAEPRDAVRDMRPALPAPMLDVVFKSGAIVSFAYAYMTRIDFDPEGRLDLHFGDDVVAIQGRNLFDMREKLRMHRASEIREGVEAEEALKPENAAHVERIEIVTETERRTEASRYDGAKHKGIER